MDIPRDFSSVDRKSRMAIPSRGLLLRPAAERVKDWDEAIIRIDEEWAKYEATPLHPLPRPWLHARKPARRKMTSPTPCG